MSSVFYARRDRRAVLPILFGFLILLSPVLPLWLDPPESDFFRFSWFAIFPIAIYTFFIWVMVSSLLKMFIVYQVSPKGMVITVPPFHRKVINKEDIEELKLLTGEETTKMVSDSIMEQDSYGRSGDIVGYIQMLKKKSPYFRYYTLGTSAKVTTIGPAERITYLQVKQIGESLLLQMKNGDKYYLTPSDPEGLYHSAQSVWK